MKKIWMWCLVGLLILATVSFSGAQQTGETQKAVAALENQWLQSQKTSNPDILAPLLADKFVNTGNEGKVTEKAATLAIIKSTKFDSAEYVDLKVTAFGSTAIATGGLKGKGKDASGKPFTLDERWTDTWVKMPDGKWQCVASHSSAVQK